MPEAQWCTHTRWLTCLTIAAGATREDVRLAREANQVEARPAWKPMHLQPAYSEYEFVGGSVSAGLFEHGLCLPSGSSMTAADIKRVVDRVRGALRIPGQ